MDFNLDWNGLGVVGVVLFMGVLVVRGLLVPRRTYDDKAHEAAEWRAESRIKDQQIAELHEQLRHLEEVGRATNAVLRAIQQGTTSRHEVPE